MSYEKLSTPLVSSPKDVPDGFRRLAEIVNGFAASMRYREAGAHAIREYIKDARRRGEVDAVKVATNACHVASAPVYVNERQCRKAVEAGMEAARARRAMEPPVKPEPVAVEPVAPRGGIAVRVSAVVEPLVVELQALRASVAELARSMRDLQAAVELRAESELSSTHCVKRE